MVRDPLVPWINAAQALGSKPFFSNLLERMSEKLASNCIDLPFGLRLLSD